VIGEDRAGARHLSGPLLIATLALPALFVWFFLRKGYPASLRKAAFTYFIAITAFGLMGAVSARP
jgi:hypothetical protein